MLTASTFFSPQAAVAPRQQQTTLTTQTSSETLRVEAFYADYDIGWIYHRWSDDNGTTWSPSWVPVPSSTLPGSVHFYGRPSDTTDGPGRLTIVAQDTSNSLYYKTENNGVWSPATTWSNVPGTLPSFPSKVSINNIIYTFNSAPTVSSWGPGRLDLFVYAYINSPLDATRYLLHTWADTSVWTGQWEVVATDPAYGYGQPSAVSWGPGRIDLFLRGITNELEHKWYDANNGGWHPWENLGGVVYSTPGVSAAGPGSLHIVVGNAIDGLSFREFAHGTWSEWVVDGNLIGSSPADADTPEATHMIASDFAQTGYLYRHRNADGTWTSWVSIGGGSQFGNGNYDPALIAWTPQTPTPTPTPTPTQTPTPTPTQTPAPTVVMPNLVSLDQSLAELSINEVGLVLGSVKLDNTCQGAEGTVVQQDPASGTVVPLGTVVNLLVSSGLTSKGTGCPLTSPPNE